MYERYVSQAMGNYWRRQNAYQPSGLEMVLGGLAQGIGTGYEAYLRQKTINEQQARQAEVDARNTKYMEAQMEAMQKAQKRAEESSLRERKKAAKEGFIRTVPIGPDGKPDTSAWAEHIKGEGEDPSDPNFATPPTYSPAEIDSERRRRESEKGRPAPKVSVEHYGDYDILFEDGVEKSRTKRSEGSGSGEAGTWSTHTDKEGRPWRFHSKTGAWIGPDGKPGVPQFAGPKPEKEYEPTWADADRVYRAEGHTDPLGNPKPGHPTLSEWAKDPANREKLKAIRPDAPPAPGARPAPAAGQPAPQAGGYWNKGSYGFNEPNPFEAPQEAKVYITRTGTDEKGAKVGQGSDGKLYQWTGSAWVPK